MDLFRGSLTSLIIGLGNPGSAYENHRHNVGYWLVDEIAKNNNLVFRNNKTLGAQITDTFAGQVRLAKPNAYMNVCGLAVKKASNYYRIPPEQLLIVHDDLDLPAGSIRLKAGGGHGGHNGLRDIISHIGNNFARIRLGVGHPGNKNAVKNYVLSSPGKAEKELIINAIDRTITASHLWLGDNWAKAQQQLHSNQES